MSDRTAPSRRPLLAVLIALLLPAVGPGVARGAGADLRVFHGRPGSGPLDLQVDGAPRVRRVLAGRATDYLRLPVGRHTLVVRRSARGAPPLTRLRVVLRAGRAYTLAVTGTPRRPRLRLLRDDRRTLRRAARVRLVHLWPDRPALRLVLRRDGSTAVRSLRFGAASPYRRATPAVFGDGVLPIDLRDAARGATLARAALAVRPGRAYSLFVIPGPGAGPLRLVLAQDS